MHDDLQTTVSDPTDFPPEANAPGLRQLDGAFRCGICGEIYDAPMMLQCGHSFCSMCARQSLRERHECPQCRRPAEEIHLTKNVQLEELGVSWRIARDFTLRLLKKVDELTRGALDVSERPRKRHKPNSSATPRARRNAASPAPATRNSTPKSENRNNSEVAEVIEDSDDDVFYRGGDYVPSSDVEENEIELEQVVSCPICTRGILMKNANAHIESNCTSLIVGSDGFKSRSKRTDTKNAWDNMFGGSSTRPGLRTKGKGRESRQKSPLEVFDGTVERLPKPSYPVLKEKKIREMLAEHQLSTIGSKEQLVARHTQFVLMFNANLDRAESLRKPMSEIRKDLKRWEEGVTAKKPAMNDTHAYLKANNSDFKKHVEAARATLACTRTKEKRESEPSLENDETNPNKLTTPDAVNSGDDTALATTRQLDSNIIEDTVVADSQEDPRLL
ncbi:hypothetical protein M0805_004869 [Coniferiporia weirii]|nr:hypothetical protein M0805_004869 [Coniferiporia weirii]